MPHCCVEVWQIGACISQPHNTPSPHARTLDTCNPRTHLVFTSTFASDGESGPRSFHARAFDRDDDGLSPPSPSDTLRLGDAPWSDAAGERFMPPRRNATLLDTATVARRHRCRARCVGDKERRGESRPLLATGDDDRAAGLRDRSRASPALSPRAEAGAAGVGLVPAGFD